MQPYATFSDTEVGDLLRSFHGGGNHLARVDEKNELTIHLVCVGHDCPGKWLSAEEFDESEYFHTTNQD